MLGHLDRLGVYRAEASSLLRLTITSEARSSTRPHALAMSKVAWGLSVRPMRGSEMRGGEDGQEEATWQRRGYRLPSQEQGRQDYRLPRLLLRPRRQEALRFG